jgi:acyl-coenzyme A synthetase/AMP-(fatty) acid ligase
MAATTHQQEEPTTMQNPLFTPQAIAQRILDTERALARVCDRSTRARNIAEYLQDVRQMDHLQARLDDLRAQVVQS